MKELKGDLVEMAKRGDFDIIVHGCNCFNTMGAGIAKQIRENFPESYEADCRTAKGSALKLGSFSVARAVYLDVQLADNLECINIHQSIFYIVNAYTQYGYGREAPRAHFEPNAFITFLESFKNYVDLMYKSNMRKNEVGRFNDQPVKLEIAFPRIGCGLGGGDWEHVQQILSDFASEVSEVANVTVVSL